MTILTVDDTPANIRLLTHYLEKQKYNVITAEDGFEGFKAAIQYHPDLILLDVMMPGTDGYEVCELLKAEEETKDIPVMFLTAKTAVEDKIRGFELGAVDYITKPFNLVEIATRVQNQLSRKVFELQNKRYQQILERTVHLSSIGKVGAVLSESLLERLKFCQDQLNIPNVDISQIQSIIDGLYQSVTQYHTYTNTENPIRKSVKLRDLIDEVINEMDDLTKGSAKYSFHALEDEPFIVVGDPGELYLTIYNLLFNAYESSPGGFDIIIEVKQSMPSKDLLKQQKTDPASSYLAITVTDGRMYDPKDSEIQEGLFIPSDDSELSLRYSAVYSIIHDHEGFFSIEKADSSGRLISIYLPN
ncbi:response regulator [candidate division KSB1 bacterium]|nr:response regulator [candidate division KSB1 bacterium]